MVERPADDRTGWEELSTRRGVLGGLGGVVGLVLAGCSGGGGGGTETPTTEPTETETATETATETTTVESTEAPTETTERTTNQTTTETTIPGGSGGEYTREGSGRVEQNAVGKLAIRGWTSEVKTGLTGQKSLFVTLTIENVGEKSTELMKYSYELTYYAEDGSVLKEGRAMRQQQPSQAVPPGETDKIQIALRNVENPGAVAEYAVRLKCPVTGTTAYC